MPFCLCFLFLFPPLQGEVRWGLSPPLQGVKGFARLSVQWTVIEPYGWGFYRTRYKTEGLPNHYRRITEG